MAIVDYYNEKCTIPRVWGQALYLQAGHVCQLLKVWQDAAIQLVSMQVPGKQEKLKRSHFKCYGMGMWIQVEIPARKHRKKNSTRTARGLIYAYKRFRAARELIFSGMEPVSWFSDNFLYRPKEHPSVYTSYNLKIKFKKFPNTRGQNRTPQ